MRFIEILKIKLINHGFIVKMANDDSDTLIINTAINVSIVILKLSWLVGH